MSSLSASTSSLSHSRTVRPSIAALPITAISVSGPRLMTKPPTWVAEMSREILDFGGQLQRQRQAAIARDRGRPPAPGLGEALVPAWSPARLGQPTGHVLREPERLADLADGAAAAIADDGADDGGAVAAVAIIDVLDDLLAPLMLEIDIDIGRLVAAGGDEALEQQVML